MFISLTFVLYTLCIYTYFKHKNGKLCNINSNNAKCIFVLGNNRFICVHYNIERKNSSVQTCRFSVCRAASLVYIQHRPGQCLYVVKFYSCLYIVRFFCINIQYYCIFCVYLCSLGLFLYVYAINIQFYTVLCGKIEHLSK